jgi:drug/metabolite transporter (DMT)-like permease
MFAWPLLRQRPSVALAVGIAVAVVGMTLLAPPTGLGLGVGESWTALGAIAFGLQIVVLARFAPGADPLAITAFQAVALALVVAPFGIPRLAGAPHGSAVWPRLGYLVVAGSIVAPLCQIAAQRTLPAGRVGLLLGLEPVFAAAFAVMLAGERPSRTWWLGAALILLAVSFVEWSSARVSNASRRSPSAGTPA